MSECQEVQPSETAEWNLLHHMAIAFLGGILEDMDPGLAWSKMNEEEREAIRAQVRPLLPFVLGERARAEAAEKERDAAYEFAANLVKGIAHHCGEELTNEQVTERVAVNIALNEKLEEQGSEIGFGYVVGPCPAEARVAELEAS